MYRVVWKYHGLGGGTKIFSRLNWARRFLNHMKRKEDLVKWVRLEDIPDE